MNQIKHKLNNARLRSLALTRSAGAGPIYACRHQRGRRAVALTFDDGPSPANTPALLDLLGSHGAIATFFVVGEQVATAAELGRRIVDEGHELGNHTHTHRRPTECSRAELRLELQQAEAAIAEVSGRRPRLARPPFGKGVRRFTEVAAGLGLRTVLWSVDSGDTAGYPAEVVARFVARGHDGDVVLLHDGGGKRPTTLEATDLALTTLARRGFRCVALSELICGG